METTVSKPEIQKPSTAHAHPAPDGRSRSVADIAVVGLGYVGLPLSLQFARCGVRVLGLDIDPAKVDSLNQGRSYIKHIESSAISDMRKQDRFSASTDFALIKGVGAVIICVPTPLNKNREPDISYILETGKAIAPHLRKGTVVVLESTTYPGTTDEDLRAVLEAEDLRPPASSWPKPCTRKPSRLSCRCPPVGLQRQPSFSRTLFAASISLWSTN
jgi:3-hydroxyisobutyrate dehydrogenase-like beta-hydroxyacid dehydrogenase